MEKRKGRSLAVRSSAVFLFAVVAPMAIRLPTDPGTSLPCDRSLCIEEKSLQPVLALGDLSKNNGAGPCISAILTDELYQEDKSRIKVERKFSIG